MKDRLSAWTVVFALACTVAGPVSSVRAGTDSNSVPPERSAPKVSDLELVPEGLLDLETSEVRDTPRAVMPDAVTMRFRSPLLAHDWSVFSGYVDIDPSSPGALDFDCRSATYNGHSGTDMAIRDFFDQDEGRLVVAAAPGIVVETRDGFFDRQTSGAAASANYVIVEHADGSKARYWHLRKWSTLVVAGQPVVEGQPLGMVGSSGSSTGPHVHFGVLDGDSVVSPHSGACRSGPSLWQDQPPHSYDATVEMFYTGITTVDPTVGGRYKFRPPDVLHVRQDSVSNWHYAWFRLKSCAPTDVFRVVYRKPGGAVWTDRSAACGQNYAFVYGRYATELPSAGDQGTWTVEFLLNDVTQAVRSFVFDGVPYENPVGESRTIAVPRGGAGGSLRGSDADAGIEEFRIVGPPAHGTVVLTGPRQSRFEYVPQSRFSGADSFSFEVEDGQQQVSAPAVMTLEVSPVIANILQLHGEDDHVSISDNGSLDLTSALTLEAWVRRTAGSSWDQVLFDRRYPDNTTGFSLWIASAGSTLRFQLGDGSAGALATGTTPILMDRWTHVAATWDGVWMRLYVDGQEDGDPTAFAGPVYYATTYPTYLGRSRGAGVSFRGDIDEMRIWSVARNAAQLQQGRGCAFYQGAVPEGLRGWWRLDGTAADASPFANDGALIGSAHFRQTDGVSPVDCAGLDTDGDAVDDALDNCALAPNPAQEDSDADGVGDACDNCPLHAVPGLSDLDHDGVGNACDLCPFLADTEQVDSDGDGSGDACDPAPADDTRGVPSATIALDLDHDLGTGVTTITWNSEPLAGTYEVYRGTPAEIRSGFYGTCRSASDPDPSDTAFEDQEVPAPWDMFGYLVLGIAADGTHGLAGTTSDGRLRDLRAKDCR